VAVAVDADAPRACAMPEQGRQGLLPSPSPAPVAVAVAVAVAEAGAVAGPTRVDAVSRARISPQNPSQSNSSPLVPRISSRQPDNMMAENTHHISIFPIWGGGGSFRSVVAFIRGLARPTKIRWT